MTPIDLTRFALGSLGRQRFRSFMLLLSVAIGVAAVVMLTALGEGARRYVINEFEFLGKNTLAIFPGRKETTGGLPPVMGIAPRDITLEQVEILERTVPGLIRVAPAVLGNTEASFGSRGRDSLILGTSHDFFTIRQLSVSQGEILPDIPLSQAQQVAVIGSTVKKELFGPRRAIGQWIRLRDYRFRVIGVLTDQGDSSGFDVREVILIPVASAQTLFNIHGLFRVAVLAAENRDINRVIRDIENRMTELHEGELDVTVVSPDAMLDTLKDILHILTLGVGGIAAISLLVAGIMVMNVTLVSVRQRTAEIGLLKAMGATSRTIRSLFLTEAALLAVVGIASGLGVGELAVRIGRRAYPSIPFAAPLWSVIAASGLALAIALVFAWLPSQRAAALEPVEALAGR